MAKKSKEAKPERVHSGFLTKIVILILVVGAAVQVYHLQGQVAAAEEEKAAYEEKVETLRQENASLQSDLDEGSTQEKMEEIAREELGLVTPGEYVFYDVSN